jgi:Skp family chaperone for outer membrane proteins
VPQVIKELEINEVSLVDWPANRDAKVAFFKRDRSNAHDRAALRKQTVARLQAARATRLLTLSDRLLIRQGQLDDLRKSHAESRERLHTKFNREEQKMEFQQSIKSAGSRDEICKAVRAEAAEVAVKKGCTLDQAEANIWRNRDAAEAYESARKSEPKRAEPKMFQATPAEGELDRRARKIMKNRGESYAKSCSIALMEDPGLYSRYERELAAGTTYTVPAPQTQFLDAPTAKAAKPSSDEGGGECPECGSEIDEGDSYCSDCGADLSKPAKTKPKPRA